MIVEYEGIRKLYSIKELYAQPQAQYIYIPLRNDQGQRDMKYHRNTKVNIMYIDMY